MKIETAPAMRRFNRAVESFDALHPFSNSFDRSDPWAIVLECERRAERAIDTQDAAGWYRLALEIRDSERAVNPRSLDAVAPLLTELVD